MLIVGVSEFGGTWLMNHDGLKGKLVLECVEEEVENSENPVITLVGRYADASGQPYPVDSISVDVHRISFIIHFTEHSQLYRGYLFTETRDAMAGYTIRGEERFGWFAILAESPLIAS
ncbi:MAG: hypothetical protein H8D78_05675 [Chloroflexi bacterium]|nr:hypothetical protein [Chloroflexota bacterium]